MLRRFWTALLYCLGFDPRGIFVFYDGRWERHCDPFETARKLWSTMSFDGMPFESKDSIAQITSGIGSETVKGYAQVAVIVREVFGIKPLSEGGLTEDECAKLLIRFENYLGDVKKNGSGLPIPPNSSGLGDESSPLNKSSDSGSISAAPIYVVPDVEGLLPPLAPTTH